MKKNLGRESSHHASVRLADKYHISSKAIRDIWKGRSWLDATFDLWSDEDRPPRRVVGRPKGKKDSKPRITRIKAQPRPAHEAQSNALLNAACASRPSSMASCRCFDASRFTPRLDASRTPDSGHHSRSISFGRQIPWSPDASNDGRSGCLLPSFRNLIQGMGLVPAEHDPFSHQAVSPPARLSIQNDCGSFPAPSMFGAARAQDNILALVASRVLSSRSALAVSATPFGFGAGHLLN